MTSVISLPLAPNPTQIIVSPLTTQRATAWHVSRVVVLFVMVLGGLFLFFCLRRLGHTDLWSQLARGRAIVASNSLPATEQMLPLATGVPVVETEWLTETLSYWALKRWGVVAIQFFGSLVVTAMSALVVYRAYQRSRSLDLALTSLVLFVWGCWSSLGIFRSQLIGMLCFVALLTMVTSRERRMWQWCAVPVLFMAWANFDGSFPAGLALLSSLVVGRIIDVLMRCRQLRAVMRDSQVRCWTLMLELAVVATLLNPHGLSIYHAMLGFISPPNATGLSEWEALSLRNMTGQVAALIALQLIVLYRFSPRRVASAEVLWLFGFGAASLWSSRLLVWWIPLSTYCFVLHASPLLNAWNRSRGGTWRPPLKSKTWSFVCIGLIFAFVGATPFAQRLAFGKSHSPKLSGVVSTQTPLGISQHLHRLADEQRLPTGLAFHPHDWGDFLLWAAPQTMQVFANSQPFALPREVWSDYLTIIQGNFDGESLLDRYGVNLIILDDERHHLLIHHLAKSEIWQRTYSDSVGTVFVRRQPI